MNLNKFSHWRFLSPILLIFAACILPFSIVAQKKLEPVITLSSSDSYSYYSVGIYEDGTAIFDGSGRGLTDGVKKYKIPQTKFAELIAEFDRSNFFSLNDSYPSIDGHGGSTTISFSHNGKRKTVVSEIGLKEFDELEHKIRDVADVDRFYDAMSLIKLKTDNALLALGNDPAAKLIITINGTAGEMAKAERRIRDHVKFRGYDMKRINLVKRFNNRRIKIDYKLILPDTE